MIDSLSAQLRRDEGEILHAYEDSLGYWTIGVGRLIDARRGGGISPEESNFMLQNDINHVVDALEKAFPWTAALDPIRLAVLQNMAFQMGVGGLGEFRQMLAAVQSGDWTVSAEEMLSSKWAEQTPARAHRLALQLESGQWQ